ncbi:MAG: DNA-binding transcriptional MocR family regulator [Arenicella sp.]|jgi:DNA-binding transcriptional MocR family regulator
MQISKQLSGIKPSYIREILAATQAPDMLSLAGGLPATELLPVSQLIEAMTSLATSPEVFQYGETTGYRPLLDYLRVKHQLPIDHAAMICTGSQQAIDLIARAYLNPGDTVAMEAPSYLGALQVFGLAQAKIHAIEQTKDGPDLNQLETAFASGSIKMFYGVPDFHNPTGVCWSLETRKSVAELCNRYAVAFVEDVPYRELRFTGDALPLVSSFCPDNAFVMRSFSKVSSPGLRLGMVSAPSNWLDALVKIKQASDLHTGLPMQAVLLSLLQSEAFPKHIEMVRVNYKQRYQVMAQALAPLIGEHCQCSPVEGGMFVWLRLLNAKPMDVTQALLEKNVAVVPGDVFYSSAELMQPALRLNFTHSSLQELETAIGRLSDVLTA